MILLSRRPIHRAPAGVAAGVYCAFDLEHGGGALGVTRSTRSELNRKRGISPETAVRLARVFGGTEQGWLVQQAQYGVAQVRRDRIRLKRLELV